MCLVAIAHDVSARYPLVIAANRDEAYERATIAAAVWDDDPDVLGGRDAAAGGSWLAVRRSGRFAAVTNLRGAVRTLRSRGSLVRDFVTGRIDAAHYAHIVLDEAGQYAGFHLVFGDETGDVRYVTRGLVRELGRGIHAFSNAPAGEEWSKVAIAADEIGRALQGEPEEIAGRLLQFLATSRGAPALQDEVFVTGDLYGTRSSTVIVATPEEIFFTEQAWAAGGQADGPRREFRLIRNGSKGGQDGWDE